MPIGSGNCQARRRTDIARLMTESLTGVGSLMTELAAGAGLVVALATGLLWLSWLPEGCGSPVATLSGRLFGFFGCLVVEGVALSVDIQVNLVRRDSKC